MVGIPAGVFHSMFSMVNLEKFDLTPESNGRLLSYIGVLTMVGNLTLPNLNLLYDAVNVLAYARARSWAIHQEIL